VHGSGSPRAQRSSSRQKASAATSLAVSERIKRVAVLSVTPYERMSPAQLWPFKVFISSSTTSTFRSAYRSSE
jgi:hypothetical protein